jgi:dynein assembly factor with WDR repeat domains 1
MKLQKIYLRYFPPGLAFSYVRNNNKEETKCVDVFELTASADLNEVIQVLKKREPAIMTKDIVEQVKELLEKMQTKLREPPKNKFYLHKTLHAHILPLTNVDFDRSGTKCITGSYDRTCRVWNVDTGCETNVLKGHENVVFSVAFNHPKCDKIVTGSFDKTAKIWNASSGACVNTLWGHNGEIVGTEFSKNGGDKIATCSMDGSAIVWSTGKIYL